MSTARTIYAKGPGIVQAQWLQRSSGVKQRPIPKSQGLSDFCKDGVSAYGEPQLSCRFSPRALLQVCLAHEQAGDWRAGGRGA